MLCGYQFLDRRCPLSQFTGAIPIIRAQQCHLKQRGRHLWAQRAAHHAGSAFHVQLVLPYAEVILLTQVRESCAARPLGVEAGESATASPAQPDRPRNTGDPWETERPGCDSYSFPCTLGDSPDPSFSTGLPCFCHLEEEGAHLVEAHTLWQPSHARLPR